MTRPALGQARRVRIPPVFERGATPPGGMQRRPNAAGLSPRAARSFGSTAKPVSPKMPDRDEGHDEAGDPADGRNKCPDAETCVIYLTKYNRLNRAQILYNHIYFSDLPVAFKSAILNGRNYLKIIDHHNYNPRIIDLMTQYSRLQHVLPHDYFKSFMSNGFVI